MSSPSPNSTPVDIVLATYNGQDHLRHQLDSLLQQEHVHWNLWLRDDGSSDLTSEILDEYCRLDSRIHRLPHSPDRRGPLGNFGDLMQVLETSDAPYLFFCDQDDVWNSNKLLLQIQRLQKLELQLGTQTPLATHSDLSLIDGQGILLQASANQARKFHPETDAPFSALLAQNFVTGCTLAINKALWKLALPVPPTALMHDWWIALLASAVGHLDYLPQPTVLYRQHAHNASGSARPKSLKQGIVAYLSEHQHFRELMEKRLLQSMQLQHHLCEKGYSQHPRVLWLKDFHQTLKESPLRAALLAARQGIHMQGWARTCAYYALLSKTEFP